MCHFRNDDWWFWQCYAKVTVEALDWENEDTIRLQLVEFNFLKELGNCVFL
jgi:hypothetical protein